MLNLILSPADHLNLKIELLIISDYLSLLAKTFRESDKIRRTIYRHYLAQA
jgi:hypothetical protein